VDSVFLNAHPYLSNKNARLHNHQQLLCGIFQTVQQYKQFVKFHGIPFCMQILHVVQRTKNILEFLDPEQVEL